MIFIGTALFVTWQTFWALSKTLFVKKERLKIFRVKGNDIYDRSSFEFKDDREGTQQFMINYKIPHSAWFPHRKKYSLKIIPTIRHPIPFNSQSVSYSQHLRDKHAAE